MVSFASHQCSESLRDFITTAATITTTAATTTTTQTATAPPAPAPTPQYDSHFIWPNGLQNAMPTISENQRSRPLRQIVPGHCRASNPRGDAAKFGVQWWRIHPITNGKIHGKIRLSIGWFTKGFPQFMKNPWLLLRVGLCGSPLHIANTGALSASGTTPRKWQVTKSWITTHLWTIHGKWLVTWVKDMTH